MIRHPSSKPPSPNKHYIKISYSFKISIFTSKLSRGSCSCLLKNLKKSTFFVFHNLCKAELVFYRYITNVHFKQRPLLKFGIAFKDFGGCQGEHLYLIGQKFVEQNCRNSGLVSKILSDEKFFPLKILSNISIQKSGKNRTKLSQFRLGVEKFVRQNFVRLGMLVLLKITKN